MEKLKEKQHLVLNFIKNKIKTKSIIIFLIGNKKTYKRFFKKDDKIILKQKNKKYFEIISNNIKILGKIICLFKKFQYV